MMAGLGERIGGESQSRLRRVVRPLGYLAGCARIILDPGDLSPPFEGHTNASLSSFYDGTDSTKTLVEMARVELNAHRGRPLDKGLPEDSTFRREVPL